MRNNLLLLIAVFILGTAMKSDKAAYEVYDLKGKDAEYKDILKAALESDIILFGELHNSPICHWLELELTTDLYAEKKENLVIGAEMFETDDQLIIDEYLAGLMKEKNFEGELKVWDNYKTDYKPLVSFALNNKLRFIGTNVPRRYASLVNKRGFEALDSLTTEAKSYLPPLPVAYDASLKGYVEMVQMMKEAGGHDTLHIAKAQAIKDATMAFSILQNWSPGKTFIHYNGTYHSNIFEGIYWYLKQANPDLRILTIASAEQDTLGTLTEENANLADFTILVPSNMTKTY
jgi:uncharacterized iron-regulated protein